MTSFRYSIAILIGLLGLYHLVGLFFAAAAFGAVRKLEISDGGSLEEQLFYIELGLLFLFFVLLVCTLREWRFGTVIAIAANVCILAIYVWWFFEKYTFQKVVYGLREESSEYKTWLLKIGYFRGMEPIHYWFLIPTFLAVISVFILVGYDLFGTDMKAKKLE